MTDTGTALAERQAKPTDMVRAALERMKPQIALALPRHLTADRLLRVVMTAVQNSPKLLECDRTSLYSAIMTCAQLGLEPDGVLGQAYLVPFAGRVQFIPGYRGLIALARNSGEVSSIRAREVREKDTFDFDFGSDKPPEHRYDIRLPTEQRGDIVAFWAIAWFIGGGFHWDMMTLDEVTRIRDRSQGWQSAVKFKKTEKSPWHTDFEEMAKKTVIRRIAKYLPMSVQKAAALADAYDTGKHARIDNHGDLVIEGEASEEALNGAPQIERRETQLEQFEREHAGEPTNPVEPRDSGDFAIPHTGDNRAYELALRQRISEASDRLGLAALQTANQATIDQLDRPTREGIMSAFSARAGELSAQAA